MKYELGEDNQMQHIYLETPIVVKNVLVVSKTGQSRPLLTDITVTAQWEHVHHSYSDPKVGLYTFRVWDGVTREGMDVSARVSTFKNTDWYSMEWTPAVGTQLSEYGIWETHCKYEGHE